MEHPLKIILWPDPRLRAMSKPVEQFDQNLRDLVAGMFALMRESRGVGLAAPQVGVNLRLFVLNHNGEPASDRIYINPVLTEAEGDEEAEEGCLSLPKVNCMVNRSKAMRMRAQDVEGNFFEQVETGYIARIWQHETDHLNGVLLVDRMGPGTRMLHRKVLKDLEEQYAAEHPAPKRLAKKRK